MKHQIINGVPYLIKDNNVYVYSSVPQIHIGSYIAPVLTIHDDWQSKMEDWLAHYRKGLKEQTEEALKKAAELQKA